MRGIAARAKRDDREMIAWDHFYWHQSIILLESQILQFDIVNSSFFVQIALNQSSTNFTFLSIANARHRRKNGKN